MIKTSITLLFFFLTATLVRSQDVEQRFRSFAGSAFTEKLYLHTDKNDYLAGDILWWKTYYVDGYTHHPADLSRVVYVELIDKSGKPVLQAKGALDSGANKGSFYIPLNIQSGTYLLRAYTSWMKNFSSDYFFNKQINIINPLRATPLTLQEQPPLYDAAFFPEGGDLVQGLESRIGFRVTDQSGVGQTCRGVILGDRNDTVASFQTQEKGIGSFLLTPVSGRKYQAIIRLQNDQTIVRDLPAVKQSGYVMQVLKGTGGELQIRISSTNESGQVSLFAHTRQIAKIFQKAVLRNGTATIQVKEDLLGEGISQLTLFDPNNQPVAERLYFRYPVNRLRIEAGSDNREYGLRSKISLSVQSLVSGSPVPASLSVSVYRLDSLQSATGQDIESYFWLAADLKGTVEDAGWYFGGETSTRSKAMDNLMLTHGWRRFRWQDLKGDSLKVVYQPEVDGHIITARLADVQSATAVKGEQVFLGIPGILTQFYAARTDSNGQAHFDARQYYGGGDLVLQPDTSLKLSRKVNIINPFMPASPASLSPLRIPRSYSEQLAQAGFAMQVRNIYAGDSLNNYRLPDLDSLPFYGKHGKIYNLDEYTRFTTMEEVLREYVLEIGIRQRNGAPHLLVLDFVNKGFLTQEPLILLDGVPVPHSTILAFDPLKVRKLQVVPTRYVIGDFVYDGVVSFTTYKRTAAEIPENPLSTIQAYDGLQLEREFFSPRYVTPTEKSNRIPDYRTQLYWNPEVTTGKTGTATAGFFSSDVPGKYQIVWEGMDKQGHAGSKTYIIEVRSPEQ